MKLAVERYCWSVS